MMTKALYKPSKANKSDEQQYVDDMKALQAKSLRYRSDVPITLAPEPAWETTDT